MSILFFHNEDQEIMAKASKELEEQKKGKKFHTDIIPVSSFYLAETYHQKYYLQLRKHLLKEYLLSYPDTKDLIYSTSAARINGYVRGEGTILGLKSEIDLLGLTKKGQVLLTEIVESFGK